MSQAKNVGIVTEVFNALSDFNKKYFRTTKTLLLQPQQVVDAMLADSANKQYVNPFRFALLTYSLFAVVAAYLDLDMVTLGLALGEGEPAEFSTWLLQILDKGIVAFSFIALIPVGWLVTKLFKSSGRGNLVCYKISLYIYSMSTLIGLIIITPIALIFSGMSVMDDLVMTQYAGTVSVIYIIWGYMHSFSVSLWEGAWKGVISFIWYYAMSMCVMLVLVIIFAIYAAINGTFGN
jgi:hypothetical protein